VSGQQFAATAVAIETLKGPLAVLLRGASGAGKSDLALRLIDGGAKLIGDDQVMLTAEGGWLRAGGHPAIKRLIEVRGVGVIAVPVIAAAPVALLIDLVAPGQVARLPEPAFEILLGARVPRLALAGLEASAPAKVRFAVAALAAVPQAGVTFPFADA
jgi:HPr kinase/phosphorylase